MHKISLVVIALFFASLICSCDSSETPSSNNNTTTPGQDSMFFTIDGVSYKYKLTAVVRVDDSIQYFDAIDTVLQKHMRLTFVHAALGTYSTKDTTPGIAITYYDNPTLGYESFRTTQDSCTFVVTELTPRFKATFYGTLNSHPGNPSTPPHTVTLTGGSIDAKIK
jgi:hypothetical protein